MHGRIQTAPGRDSVEVKAMRHLLVLAAIVLASLGAAPASGPRVPARGLAPERVQPGPLSPPNPFEDSVAARPRNRIDELVFSHLARLGLEPARPASDAAFLRRAYLDAIGTLPTAAEAREFLIDRSPTKRAALIDRLLERDEFADYWAMKWCDLLRVKAEFPVNLWPNAAQAYHHWIRGALRENRPYDQVAREMLTASGSNFRVPPVNFYRAVQGRDPQAIAQVVALTFMGMRTETWSKERLAGLAAFFSQVGYKATGEWKEEIVYFDPTKPAPSAAVFPDGTPAHIAAGQDPREVFADWLVAPKNPWFARAVVNRIWFWLLGRGIVHEPDDIRPDNPPSNPELLAYLERELLSARFDLKHVFRLILNSQTYQLSCVPRANRPEEAAAQFACYPLRRLDAEVLIDALCQITGTAERYSSAIPEPFTFIPEDLRTIALPDGSITSSFLEMFGRPARDTGLLSERNNRTSAAQRLYLLNSNYIQAKIQQGPRLAALLRAGTDVPGSVRSLYLTILSRFPTAEEMKTAETCIRAGRTNPRDAAIDVAWALINSAEFLYRH
jgi:hypothetical protein